MSRTVKALAKKTKGHPHREHRAAKNRRSVPDINGIRQYRRRKEELKKED